ncbi:MAG: secretin N-terminal domain-containing protein, partial [Methylomonas sp.]
MKVKRIKAPYVLAALVLAMTGCEYLGPQIHTKLPLPEVPTAQEGELQVQPELEKKTTMVELFPNGEPSITQQPAGTATEAASKKSKGKGEYSLNFDDADLGEVAKVILSDILGKNYTISPQVTGKVTLQTTSPLTKEELMPTLDMLLSVNNAALVNQGGMYLIKPANEAVYGSPVTAMPNGYQTRVIPIRNVSAGDVAEILKPLLPEKALLQADTTRNILLVAGSGAELNRVMELVRIFDVDMLRGRSFGLFTPAHVDASKIIDELNEIFNSKKGKEGADSFFKFIEIDRMNAVLAITHKASYLQDIETWVKRLDRTNAEAGGGVHVYKAQNVSAAELADTLNDIFGVGGGGRSKGASIASGRRAMSATNRSGGSSGMGKAAAADVVAGGGSVVIVGRDKARVEETVAELSKNGPAVGITAD